MKINRKQLLLWSTLAAILVFSLFLRIVGIGRTESIDYHPDEWVLAQPIHQIANQGQVGLKTHYKWSGCGVIYPVGYSLYLLKPVFQEYSYETILRILRVLSAIASVGSIWIAFLFLGHYHSIRAAYIGAVLLGVSKFPAIAGHYATLDSLTMLIAIVILLASYKMFHLPEDSGKIPLARNFLLGMLIGWGIAVKWTLLLAAIPLFVAFVSAFFYAARIRQKTAFLKQGLRQCIILGLGLVLGFLVFFPDVQFAPGKVKEGLDYETKHHQTGHYGAVLDDAGALGKKMQRTYSNFAACGGKILVITGLCSLAFAFFKRNSLKWFLFFCFLLWTYVPFRNLVSPPRHYLVPFLIMILLLAIAADFLLSVRSRTLRIAIYISADLVILTSLLYTCINISPFWQEDPRVACAKWIMNNVPEGSGVTWAPRHQPYNWAVPGTRIAPELFKQFPRQAEPGKDQYFIVSPNVSGIFRKHPPTRKVVPSEWFPTQPPTQQEVLFFYEVNQGGGPTLEQVKSFSSTPAFLGITLKLFGESPHASPTFACKDVQLFKIRKPTK